MCILLSILRMRNGGKKTQQPNVQLHYQQQKKKKFTVFQFATSFNVIILRSISISTHISRLVVLKWPEL